METAKLKRFAQYARRSLIEQVSAKLKLVLSEDSAARRETPKAVARIEKEIFKEAGNRVQGAGKNACTLSPETSPLVERVAYIWFNRFCALRFMDVNRYNRVGIVSPADPRQFQPEILAEAKMGHIDDEMAHDKIRQQVFALLDGKAPSRDPQGEAYRLLVVAACNYWNKAMPFLFERIEDYTELLMPDDLLSGNSILAQVREAIAVAPVESGKCEVGSKDAASHSPLHTSHSSTSLEVEVIGWLYQFYISEKKDEVFDGLKKNKKITPENIPSATQLFTPHWIVRYLVENSLGRLWMQNRPNSRLVERMEYYIRPESNQSSVLSNQQGENTDNCTLTTDYLRVSSPEEIKICDPACGSGHMLTYAFDLLYAIYEEEGYEPAEIPEKILTHNLYGIEIDERAGELAAFALTMKARAKQRRFFNKEVKPNICVLENMHFDEGELGAVVSNQLSGGGSQLSVVSKETRSAFLNDMQAFEEADNFGSLIRPQMTTEQIAEVEKIITDNCKLNTDIFESLTHQKVLQVLRQADYLSPKYHVVIANPPYMGSKGMNGRLGAWAKDNYPNSKTDLFAMFIERGLELVPKFGYSAMVTMQSWMFLSSYEKLRQTILTNASINCFIQIGYNSFPELNSKVAQACAFIINNYAEKFIGSYINLNDAPQSADKQHVYLSKLKNNDIYRAFAYDFRKIPGAPIAYWFGRSGFSVFEKASLLAQVASVKTGMTTADNARFVRIWSEVAVKKVGLKMANGVEAEKSGKKWFPYNKGGGFRRWYGFNENLINWEFSGKEIKENLDDNEKPRASVRSEEFYFKSAITYSAVTSGSFSARVSDQGFLFDSGGSSVFCKSETDLNLIGGLLCSVLPEFFLSAFNDTINFQPGDIGRVPIITLDQEVRKNVLSSVRSCVNGSRVDWDSYETSWDFTNLPLQNPDYRQPTLKATYQKLHAHWREMTLEMQRLEEENNRIFIEAYGLQDELTPEVPLNEITLTCNPYYRYGKGSNQSSVVSHQQLNTDNCKLQTAPFPEDAELEARLLQDTMKELVSYAVGCMFGRYSLDAPGLILANQGEGFDDYWRILNRNQLSVISCQKSTENCTLTTDNLSDNCTLITDNSSSSFTPDEDNVIPILDGDWFTDDITERFRQFLRVAFGEEHYEENLKFVEQALNVKGKREYTLRDYFLGEFYTDHIKRYKKRPIYWLFSSPKGSFNALIYMHRYRSDTVSVVLNDYLRKFRTKLTAHKNHLEAVSISASAAQSEKTKALKEIEKINKMIAELEEYEREVLYPLATQQIEINLDDGVKANYPKFGAALKKIPGLDAKEDD